MMEAGQTELMSQLTDSMRFLGHLRDRHPEVAQYYLELSEVILMLTSLARSISQS
jgi:hypothetical protein